jgi:hypothetical protein
MCPAALLVLLASPILATTSMGAKRRGATYDRGLLDQEGTQMHESIPCPQCGAEARISERFWLDSTDGPVEHLKTSCVNNHWLTPRAEMVALQPLSPRERVLAALVT